MLLETEEEPFNKWFQMELSLKEQKMWNRKYELYKTQKQGSKDFPGFLKHCFSVLKRPYPNLEDPFFLTTLESHYKTFMTSQKKIFKEMHPPLTDIIYQPTENTKVECIPFSHDPSENPAAKQQNYANLSLNTIGNNSVWKEKFLAGLPALFAERVKEQIRSKHNGNIPYHDYTYGELASLTLPGLL